MDESIDPIKTQIENQVGALLSDKIGPGIAVASHKYLTPDNAFVYLTHVAAADKNLPPIKIQVFRRVEGGVRETGYQLYSDHRFERYDNPMIFGQTQAESSSPTSVSRSEAMDLQTLLSSLTPQMRLL